MRNAIILGPAPPPPVDPVGVPKPPPLPTGKPPPSAPVAAPLPEGAQDLPVQEEELDPDEKRRQELLAEPAFAKFVKLYKLKVPIQSLLNQIRAAGQYKDDDMLLFATTAEIKKLKEIGEYKGTKF